MKYIILLVLVVNLYAKEYKAVFDCSSSDAYYIKTRMLLINKTISMIEEKGDKANFVITLHGSCVPMISKNYEEIVDDDDLADIKLAQKYITDLATSKQVKVIACAMSLKANMIQKKEVLNFVKVSKNSFIDTIEYQNNGFGLMTFK